MVSTFEQGQVWFSFERDRCVAKVLVANRATLPRRHRRSTIDHCRGPVAVTVAVSASLGPLNDLLWRYFYGFTRRLERASERASEQG